MIRSSSTRIETSSPRTGARSRRQRWLLPPEREDGHPDYVLYNAATRQTAIWHLNNSVLISGVLGPTLPAGWGLRGAADFNSDSHPDYGLVNSSNRQTAIWYLNKNVFMSGAFD